MDARPVCDAREHGLTGDGLTNDQPALAALVDRLGDACAKDGRPRVISVPPGNYCIRDAATVWRSGVSLVGAGMAATRFLLGNPGAPGAPTPLMWFTAVQHGAGPDNHLADCTFAAFQVDGSGMHLDEYDPLAKGLGLQYVLRGRFRDIWVRDTPRPGSAATSCRTPSSTPSWPSGAAGSTTASSRAGRGSASASAGGGPPSG